MLDYFYKLEAQQFLWLFLVCDIVAMPTCECRTKNNSLCGHNLFFQFEFKSNIKLAITHNTGNLR
jgi:hypothetical protein